MTDLPAPAALFTLLIAAFFLARLTAPRNRVEGVVAYVLALAVAIVLPAYVLSALTRLGDTSCWAGGGVVVLGLSLLPGITPAGRALLFRRPTLPYDVDRRIRLAGWRRLDTWLLAVMAVAVFLVLAVDFFLAIGFEPATPDAHVYHLPRMLYYLQQNSLRFFPSNYWNLVAYPKVAPILHMFAFLTGGGDVVYTQVVQFFAFPATIVALYGICRELGAPRRGSLFAALLFGLLVISIMEAPTAQNDMILTLFIAATVYFLVAYRATRRPRCLMLAPVAVALALGVKATVFIALPPLLLITIYALWPGNTGTGYIFPPGTSSESGKSTGGELYNLSLYFPTSRNALPPPFWRDLALALIALAASFLLITAPSGYVENLRAFHDPFGPTQVRKRYTMEGEPPLIFARDAGMNVLRYSVEFLEPDGVPPLPGYEYIHWVLMQGPRMVLQAVHLRLDGLEGIRIGFPFWDARPTIAGENTSSWGPAGFLLIVPIWLLALLGYVRGPGARLFAVAALCYHVAAACLMLYDPYHGRFYMTAAIFALPPLAFISLRPRPLLGRVYLTLAILIICVVAVNASLFRNGSAFFPMSYRGRFNSSLFGYGRTGELVREAPTYLPAFLDTEIPDNAVVALDTSTPFPEYFLIGEHPKRRIEPLNPFWSGHLPIPTDAQYLIYDNRSPYRQKGDTQITEPSYPFGIFYLRALKSPPHPISTGPTAPLAAPAPPSSAPERATT